MSDSVSRQVFLLSLIPRYPRSVSTTFIKNELNEAGFRSLIRTVQRDLESLSINWPITCDEGKKPFRWSWKPDALGMSFPMMDPSQALTISLAEQHLRTLLPKNSLEKITPFFKQAEQTLVFIGKSKLAKWKNKVRVVPRGQPLKIPTIRSDVEYVIYEALLNELKFRALYRKRNATESKEYIINPLGLVSSDARHYLICIFDHDRDTIRHLPLHRFTKADSLDETSYIPVDYNLDKFITSNRFSYLLSKKILKLDLLLEKDASYYLKELPINDSQKITQRKDGRVRIRASVADTKELRSFLLSFDSSLEVLGPARLRREFEEMTSSMRNLYC
ncbi:uncharacterized protein METZ01_LOCUS106142 [marine metagenome]|uniref:Uncharacterized protein n=1 Tax=marine metagenome TaxID=408172 RepID=A0A381WM68_9ZZZZ